MKLNKSNGWVGLENNSLVIYHNISTGEELPYFFKDSNLRPIRPQDWSSIGAGIRFMVETDEEFETIRNGKLPMVIGADSAPQ